MTTRQIDSLVFCAALAGALVSCIEQDFEDQTDRPRDEFSPPAEDKVLAIAKVLGRDPDELLALAGKVSSELTEIIRHHPREMALFLRSANGLTAEQMGRLTEEARKAKD